MYEDGSVSSGTLAFDTQLRPLGWQNNSVDMSNAGFAAFTKETLITFTPEGEVTSCTLKEPLKWKNNGTEIMIPAGTMVNFTAQGAAIIKQ